MILNMDETTLEKHKHALTLHKLEEIKTISDQCEVYWNEIVTQQYHFDRGK